MPQIHRKFDRIFKQQAVKASYKSATIKEVADQLGISLSLLSRWRQEQLEYGTGSFPGIGNLKIHPQKLERFELERKLSESKLRFEILREGQKYLNQRNLILYEFIKKNEDKYPITKMCPILGVGTGRYIRWKKKGLSEKQKQILILKKDITMLFHQYKKQQGATKITKDLTIMGYKICRENVSKYMRQMGLKAYKRKFKATTDSKHNFYTSPNILNGKFSADAPSKIWVSDITYIQTLKGFLYLTIIMDLYDRKIVGWSLSSNMSAQQTTVAAWEMAVKNRSVSEGMLFHSDRGVQYACKAFATILDSNGCIRSMSRKANHWDNAVSESFFGSFKRELIHRQEILLSHAGMRREVFNFIENWYNKERIHSSLNYQTIEKYAPAHH